ncbi:lectin-like [Benincasa hispida]|uniref:lectin-like n=1 Tax=Benincasa hispida TaxID=102211 RepID=UPI001900C061|nr:lectin-like [Benincasa hispida]
MADLEKEARENLGVKVEYGHCLKPILTENADGVVQWPSFINLYQQLIAGIYLDNGTKKYWFDKITKSNSYFIYPKGLSIAWIDDSRYWRWTIVEQFGRRVEAAELIRVSWFDVRGKIKAYFLSPGITYEIYYDLFLRSSASGWNEAVVFSIKLPNGFTIAKSEVLQNKPREQWFQIKIGEFKVDDKYGCNSVEEYEYSMLNHGGHWKTGLIVRGVGIQAKQPSLQIGCGCSS